MITLEKTNLLSNYLRLITFSKRLLSDNKNRNCRLYYEPDNDYYYLLDLPKQENSTQKEIKTAYLNHVKRKHPDQGGSHEEFLKIKNAYEILVTEKENYDKIRKLYLTHIDSTFKASTQKQSSYDDDYYEFRRRRSKTQSSHRDSAYRNDYMNETYWKEFQKNYYKFRIKRNGRLDNEFKVNRILFRPQSKLNIRPFVIKESSIFNTKFRKSVYWKTGSVEFEDTMKDDQDFLSLMSKIENDKSYENKTNVLKIEDVIDKKRIKYILIFIVLILFFARNRHKLNNPIQSTHI